MKKQDTFRRVLRALNRYLLFFLIVAFVTTCCMLLFISIMSKSMNIELTEENISAAAKITFANVLLLSLIITEIDAIRRKITVDRPAQKIIEAADKMMRGDFSVRIKLRRNHDADDRFTEIAECFNRMAEELSGTETLRSDFIANVSHELKTPLAVIQNYGKLLSSPAISENERIEYANAITDASRRLASLITNILKLNKLENQQITPNCEVYDLGEQLCECLLAFESVWEEKNIEIDTDIDEDVKVNADKEMLSLVWNNLFSNAMKFTEAGGRVTLSLKSDGNSATVRVSDTGCGISPEVGRHIFDKFYQGDSSHAGEGNGLGLALVKRVIDLTESDITVESEKGKGTTFTVRLRTHNDRF